jgi:hypothetical protein
MAAHGMTRLLALTGLALAASSAAHAASARPMAATSCTPGRLAAVRARFPLPMTTNM